MRPSPTQMCVPHESWIDFIPWPGVRDVFILDPTLYAGLERHHAYVSGFISINWLQSPAQLLDADSDNSVTLSATFKQHICDIKNWSVDEEVIAICPILTSQVRNR